MPHSLHTSVLYIITAVNRLADDEGKGPDVNAKTMSAFQVLRIDSDCHMVPEFPIKFEFVPANPSNGTK